MLFRFVTRIARVGILNSRPGGSREATVNVSDFFLLYFFCGQFSCGHISCGDISDHPMLYRYMATLYFYCKSYVNCFFLVLGCSRSFGLNGTITQGHPMYLSSI